MISVENDYANKKGQITKFYDDERIIETNYLKAYDFVKSLGPVNKEKVSSLHNYYAGKNALIWFDCDYKKVIEFVCSLEFPKENKSALLSKSKKDEILSWFEAQIGKNYLTNFNVVISSNEQSKEEIKFENYSIKLPSRRRLLNSVGTGIIDLKILSEPGDKLMDIDESNLSKEEKIEFEGSSKILKPTQKRIKFHMANTPLLVLYFINKNSGEDEEDTEDRVALHLSQHLVGYHIFIPYGNNGNPKEKAYECAKVSVDLKFLRGDDDEETQS